MKSLVADIPQRVIDQSAETTQELCDATARSKTWIGEFVAKQVKSGRWEKVWKKVGTNLVPAYRRAK